MTNTTNITSPPTAPTPPEPDGRGAPDTRPLLYSALGTLDGTIAAVRPDQLSLPTPCDDFDVRALLAHVLAVVERVARVGAGEDPFGFAETTPDEVGPDCGLSAWRAAAARVRAAWADDRSLDRIVTLPWMTAPARVVAVVYVSELSVHTWDLARATGQDPDFDDEAVGTALGGMRMALPAEGRNDVITGVRDRMPEAERRPVVPFDDAVPVADDAPLIDQLVVWCGRRP